jgi:phytoene desaturase
MEVKKPVPSLPEDAHRAIVVGAGFGGMAAALRLRAKGYRVTVLDRAPLPGGRAQVITRDGFRFDAGPTVITAPFLIEELFALFGRRMSDYVHIAPLAPWYRFRFSDGSTFDYGGTLGETLAEIRRIAPGDADGYLRMLDASEKLFDTGFAGLADQPFHDPWLMLRQVPALLRLKAHRTVWSFVAAHVESPKLRQAFSVQPLLVGGNPFKTTSIYGLIHYLERKWGVHYAAGGMGALADALARLMREVGVELRFSTTVDRLLIDGRAVRGVALDTGERMTANVVVSNADPLHLYRHMMSSSDSGFSARVKLKSRRSMGLYVLYLGIDRQYPDVARHTIWLSERYRELLDDIFVRKQLARDFSLYLHRPTANDPSFAPPGCDSLYALCPVPNLSAPLDWSREAPLLRNRIVSALETTLMPGLSAAIRAEHVMTPQDFADDYLSVDGAGFSIAPHFTQSAYFRFHNRGEGVAGLYLVGAGTHPGAGIPGVLCSAKAMDRLMPAATR